MNIKCKYCLGDGYILDAFKRNVCPVCNGLGITYPKRIGTGTKSLPKKEGGISTRRTAFKYDIAISFAGEDRHIVEPYANVLKSRGVRVFFDKYEQHELWGEDLYEYLNNVYKNKARYCVLFISSHYARKRWTSHERKSAQARAFRENEPYILPVRIDDTELPGINETINYIDLRQTRLEDLIELTVKKLSK